MATGPLEVIMERPLDGIRNTLSPGERGCLFRVGKGSKIALRRSAGAWPLIGHW
jgi:hypothetical protein